MACYSVSGQLRKRPVASSSQLLAAGAAQQLDVKGSDESEPTVAASLQLLVPHHPPRKQKSSIVLASIHQSTILAVSMTHISYSKNRNWTLPIEMATNELSHDQ